MNQSVFAFCGLQITKIIIVSIFWSENAVSAHLLIAGPIEGGIKNLFHLGQSVFFVFEDKLFIGFVEKSVQQVLEKEKVLPLEGISGTQQRGDRHSLNIILKR